MTNPTPRAVLPDWLRPVSERYLGGELGPTPWTVWTAAVLSAVNAAAAAGMVYLWGSMLRDLFDRPGGSPLLLVAGALTVVGATLGVAFALAAVMIRRRGWARTPFVCGLALGLLGLGGIYIALGAMRTMTAAHTAAGEEVAPWFVLVTVTGWAVAGLVRTDSTASWLARRRYQVRQRTSGGTAPEQHAGPDERREAAD